MGSSLVSIIIFVVAFVLPALARLYQKLEQKKLERERLQAQERRQMEMLRTGRDPEMEERARAEQQMAMATAQIAAQRQAQLAELRRRQQERLRQAAAARAGGAATQAQPSQPMASRPQPSPARPPATSAPRPGRRQAPARPSSRPARGAGRARGQLATAPPMEMEPSEGPAHPLGIELGTSISQRSLATQLSSAPVETEATVSGTPMAIAPGRGRTPTVVLGQGLGPEDWRKAFIMQEILGRPVSLREGANE